MMKIVSERHPFHDRIIAAFPEVADQPYALFSHEDTIFNPSGKDIPSYTIAHEEVHGASQKEVGVQWWWDTFLADKEFRFEEELAAYRVEYQEFCKLFRSREERAKFLHYIASNLSGPLYGSMCTLAEAKQKICQ